MNDIQNYYNGDSLDLEKLKGPVINWEEKYKHKCAEHDDLLDKFHKLQEEKALPDDAMLNGCHREIKEMHIHCNQAENERDEAVQRANKLEMQLRESLERYEKDIDGYVKAFSSMKEQRDSLARIAYLQTLEGSE